MSWLDALGDAAGPLRTAALNFMPGLRSGAEGLRDLADRIDAYCDSADPDPDADRLLVEGAGAALALILIEHIGDGKYVERDGAHRVRLGRFGFFDPFAAVETILDAHDPRSALAEAVRAAEAEARGEGSISRIVTFLSTALAARQPPLAVREHFERYVRLSDETELDLGRVIDATRDGDEVDVARSVDKLLSFLSGKASAITWAEARQRLLPRLIPPDFIDALPSDRGELAVEGVDASLHVALLIGHEERSRFVRRDEVESWGTTFGDALGVAVDNLGTRSAGANFARLDTDAGPLVVARSGDGLDAARLLLPGLHDVLAAELGSPFLAAVPHRDTLLASPASPPALVAALRRKTKDDAARAPHRISEALYLVTPGGFSAARGS